VGFEIARHTFSKSIFAVLNDAVSANAPLISLRAFSTFEVRFSCEERWASLRDGAFYDYRAIRVQDPET
jgi:hypothetical protein